MLSKRHHGPQGPTKRDLAEAALIQTYDVYDELAAECTTSLWDKELEDEFFGRHRFRTSGLVDAEELLNSFGSYTIDDFQIKLTKPSQPGKAVREETPAFELGDVNYDFHAGRDQCSLFQTLDSRQKHLRGIAKCFDGDDESSQSSADYCQSDVASTSSHASTAFQKSKRKFERLLNATYALDLPLRSPKTYPSNATIRSDQFGRGLRRSYQACLTNTLASDISLNKSPLSIVHEPKVFENSADVQYLLPLTYVPPKRHLPSNSCSAPAIQRLRESGFTARKDTTTPYLTTTYYCEKEVVDANHVSRFSDTTVSTSPSSSTSEHQIIRVPDEDGVDDGNFPSPQTPSTPWHEAQVPKHEAKTTSEVKLEALSSISKVPQNADIKSITPAHQKPARKRSSSTPAPFSRRVDVRVQEDDTQSSIIHEDDEGKETTTQTLSKDLRHSIYGTLKIPNKSNSSLWTGFSSPLASQHDISPMPSSMHGYPGQFDLQLPTRPEDQQSAHDYTFGDLAQANGLLTHTRFVSKYLSMSGGVDLNLDPSSTSFLILHRAQEAAFGSAGMIRSEEESNFRRELHRECTLARLEGVAVGYYRYHLGFLTAEDYIVANVCVCWDECWCSKLCTRFGDLRCPCSKHLVVEDWE